MVSQMPLKKFCVVKWAMTRSHRPPRMRQDRPGQSNLTVIRARKTPLFQWTKRFWGASDKGCLAHDDAETPDNYL